VVAAGLLPSVATSLFALDYRQKNLSHNENESAAPAIRRTCGHAATREYAFRLQNEKKAPPWRGLSR
jgi:hypothetical protein